jgi:hypothetical protein
LPAAAITIEFRITRADVDSLRRMERTADGAPANRREPAWFAVAKRAAFLANADVGEKREFDAARAILKKAAERLPASSLAAAAAGFQHPILSAAFARAIQDVDLRGRGADVSSAAEAASECRDAIGRFGPQGNDELLAIWKKAGRAGYAPGGASASVYHIVLVGEDFLDTLGTDRLFAAGFRAAVATAAGDQSHRFEVDATSGDGDPLWRGNFHATRASRGVGVLVVASGDLEANVAQGVAGATGIVVVDARSPARVDPEFADIVNDNNYDPRVPETVLENPGAPGVDDSLRYENRRSTRRLPDAPDPVYTRGRGVFVASPVGAERARRLVAWLRMQPHMDTVGVALPETGGDVALARACVGLLRATDDDVRRVVVPIRYASGVRNYGPEARRARELGCDALILCGPPEETAEWLRGLKANRGRMILLGGGGLDPAGLRDVERVAAEGAIFVDSNWRLAGPLRVASEESARAAGIEAVDPDFERGFVTGTMIVRRVVAGNCSPGLLRDALEDESPEILGLVRTMVNPGTDPTRPGSGTIGLPIYRIRNGVAERVALP